MSAAKEPVPFEVYEAGVYLHGTKAALAVGEMLVPGRESNFEEGPGDELRLLHRDPRRRDLGCRARCG